MKDENNQEDVSMPKNQEEMPDSSQDANMGMMDSENNNSGFKMNRGLIVLGLVLFVVALFALQKYIHFGDSSYKSKKIMAEDVKEMPPHSEQQGVISGVSGNVENPSVSSMPSASPNQVMGPMMQNSTTPPSGVAIASPNASGAEMSVQDKKQIEAVVQRYIESNPEVIAEALQNLNARATKAREDKSKDFLRTNINNIIAGRPYLGNPNGDLTIIEFFDYKCSYCRRSNIILERVMKDYPDVKVVLEPVAVLGKNSSDAVRAALAVWSISPQRFAKFHEDLINSPTIDDDTIKSVARKNGISVDALMKSMNSPEIQVLMNSNMDAAQSIGMRGVPTFIVAGELVPGSLSYESFRDLLNKAKTKKMAGK